MRNRLVVITLLPVIIFLWTIGWSLFWIGSQNQRRKTHIKPETDGINITSIIYEECRCLTHLLFIDSAHHA